MAAKGAANRLKIFKPKSKMGFLRQKPDGSTSLKFLTGNSGIVPGAENNERPVTLGTLIGKVKQGKPESSKLFSLLITAFHLLGYEFRKLCWNLVFVSLTFRGMVENTFCAL